MDTRIHNPQSMNTYEGPDGLRRVVCNTATTIEMPIKPGGSMVKWTRVDKKVVVPVKALPKALTDERVPATLPPSTPAPASTPAPKIVVPSK